MNKLHASGTVRFDVQIMVLVPINKHGLLQLGIDALTQFHWPTFDEGRV
jgi:hypothetical protein